MKAGVVGVAVLFVSAAAFADIVSWQDDDGVRHFTNLIAEVPAAQRESAQVVVNEAARVTTAPSEAPPAAPVRPEPQRRVENPPDVDGAYLAGLRRGFDAAQGGGGGGGGGSTIQINGPLAVAQSRDESAYPAASLYGYGGYLPPAWYPFVTTSFDRGRSRHQTLRMLLQDQFQLDRDGPYVYVERLPPYGYLSQGPNLNPFLPRGLPSYTVPTNARVIVR